jgi:site-specific recombinase XerD
VLPPRRKTVFRFCAWGGLKKFRKVRTRSKDEDWLFLTTRGTAPFLADNVLERIIRPAVKKLGITHVTWHLLRHWHMTVLHDEGVSIKVTQERWATLVLKQL